MCTDKRLFVQEPTQKCSDLKDLQRTNYINSRKYIMLIDKS